MSQARFSDSSPDESINLSFPEPQSQSQGNVPLNVSSLNADGLNAIESTTLFNNLPRQVLEQELHFYNERSQQAQVLLRQAQEQLQLSQLVIQRQETLTQTLQSRIDQLERELQDVHSNCDELRDRLKRQQHHTSQLKAALERCLDNAPESKSKLTGGSAGGSVVDIAMSALESWSIAKLADEKVTPILPNIDAAGSPEQNSLHSVVKISPSLQAIETKQTQNDTQKSESVDVPIELSIPTRNQPISPLIVRTHKARQGSPIATNLVPNLPKWQLSKSRGLESNQLEPNFTDSNDKPLFSVSAVKNSTMVSKVATPKFMQALYGIAATHKASEESEKLAIANSSSRKAVSSLSDIQLPQFPPLPRR